MHRWRYTREVMVVTARLASVLMALVLSGTPALVQACALLCTPEMRLAGQARAAEVAATPDDHAHHAHHAGPDGAAESATPGTAQAPASAVTTAAPGCCPDTPGLTAALLLPARADAGVTAAPAVLQLADVDARAAVWRASATRIHPPRPLAARPPLVLRI